MAPDGHDERPMVGWAAAYVRARYREGRLLPDPVVAALPAVGRDHPYADEWRCRADSTTRLLAYLERMGRPLSIVDLGCGNGWLAHRMAAVGGSAVVGVDSSAIELEQARRVFGAMPGLTFALGDFLDGALPVERADVVVLASTIQYVPEPAALLDSLLHALGPGGEVHVLDSPVYGRDELVEARARSAEHFTRIGVPEMIGVYQHHDWASFGRHAYDVLYRPGGTVLDRLRLRAGRPRSPFPWLRFRSERAS
jgi:SAM-dependent methyltransferase